MTPTPPATATGTGPAEQSANRAWILFMLVMVYTFNFLDRQIIGILSIPIQEELGLSDQQLGLMRGLSFALFYATLGVPIALLADRMNRVKIMTIALTVWSAFTAVCGLATNFWQMFMARLMVGVGEAGGVAPAYSIISDYFPPEKRARALAIYSFGIPIGSAIGIFFGGVIATALDWRWAFIIVGLMGVALAPLFFLTVREPKRGAFDPASAKTAPAPLREVLRVLVSKRSFWTLSFGAACSSMMGYGLFAWLPAYFVRSHGESLTEALAWLPGFMHLEGASPLLYAGYFYGTIVLFGGLIGIWGGGVLADKLGGAKKSAYALVPAIAFLCTAPFFAFGLLSDSILVQFVIFLIPTALGLAWLGPVLSAFQHIVPPNMRATASAVFLLINNLIGIGLGDLLIGIMSDSLRVQFGDESLRYSILAGTSFYLIASLLFFISSRMLEKDWERG
jgi:predicted MFS family arabinose efflux permease